MRTILGLQEAHDASCALLVGGRIVAAAQQERFTGLKGDYGYPRQAIDACLKEAGLGYQDLDEVVLASHNWNPVLTRIKRNANFSVADWVREQEEYWRPTLFEKRQVCYYDLFRNCPGFVYDDTYPLDDLLTGYGAPEEMHRLREVRIRTVSELTGVPAARIRTVTHEDCHRYYAYFGSPMRGEVLALTCEGIGDYSNGTVSIFSERGRTELSSTRDNHIGHIYQYMTLLLGMKPAQHEYKVMGLAPYANAKELEKSYAVFRDVLKVEGLDIVYDQKPRDLYFHFREALHGHRFDGIAGAVQLFVERLLSEWVVACVESTGLRRIVFSGGVAQNIKACKKIAELPQVDEIFVCPATGDTSLPIGACYYAMWEYLDRSGGPLECLEPLHDVYLGPQYRRAEIELALAGTQASSRCEVRSGIEAAHIAALLAEGRIIARCCGRMEFGLRALGNRSILADPRRPETVRKINDAIKFRDFWMPFTPSILEERAGDYIENPKGLSAPFMTMAFDSTDRARRDLPAALHPADFTVRPQVLSAGDNPEYHAIVKEFERLTGVGGILNTSFNLHGDPIVLGPTEAIRTFDRSGLDGVQIGEFLLLRTGGASSG